ncbi:hypothetical protein [Azotobacter vinelandii]|uniref:hypothetical protein n=1 Tax=Azotobacter vinelandii TaxID=354 RepID=UPI00091BF4B8|nr:hypothetical protein SAMN04244547_03621 [Azotobacter vinelandii]
MRHGKIHSVLRGKSLSVGIILSLAVGAAIYSGNDLPLEKSASSPAQQSSLSLPTLRSVNDHQATVPKGISHHTLLVPQPRWIF